LNDLRMLMTFRRRSVSLQTPLIGAFVLDLDERSSTC